MERNISFIGAGSMARALMIGLIAMGYPAERLFASNPPNDTLNAFEQQFHINLLQDNCEAVECADVLVLCVKPKVLPAVCKEIKETVLSRRPLVISIAAGISVDLLAGWLDPSLAIVRTMPNTPAAVGAGATGLFANDNVSEEQRDIAEALFRSVGVTVWTDNEKQIDLVTATSGSGPAYYFLMIEAMQEAAIQLGLSDKEARLLSLQTILGAARMAMESQHDAHELRASVTSPNGTTAAALAVFEDAEFKSLVKKAIQAAFERAQTLAHEIEKE